MHSVILWGENLEKNNSWKLMQIVFIYFEPGLIIFDLNMDRENAWLHLKIFNNWCDASLHILMKWISRLVLPWSAKLLASLHKKLMQNWSTYFDQDQRLRIIKTIKCNVCRIILEYQGSMTCSFYPCQQILEKKTLNHRSLQNGTT